MTGGPSEIVEDLTAETFLRGWKARQRFSGDERSATGWLILIAKRLVIDEYRRHLVQFNHQAALLPEMEAGPEQLVDDLEQKRTLLILLEELPAETREILVLRYMLDWRVQEIALYFGTTENNISVTIHRALAHIRASWQRQAGKTAQTIEEPGHPARKERIS